MYVPCVFFNSCDIFHTRRGPTRPARPILASFHSLGFANVVRVAAMA